MTILMPPSSLRTPQILTYFCVICFVYHFTLSPTEINQGCSSEYSCEAIHWNMRSFSRLYHWRQWLPLLWQPPTAISSPAELLIPFMKLLLKGGSLSLVQVYEGYCRSCEFMRVILSCLWHCPCPFFPCSLRLRVSNMVNLSHPFSKPWPKQKTALVYGY